MRIGLVAPSLMLRLGLRTLMAELPGTRTGGNPAVEIVQEASSIEGLAEVSRQLDVLVVAGEAASAQALRWSAQAQMAGVSMLLLSDDPQSAAQLQRLGLRSWGVLPADSRAEEVLAALQAVDMGLLVGKPDLLLPGLPARLGADIGAGDSIEQLTEREKQVLQLLALGLPNKQIALQLTISEHTVKFHVSSIYSKLGVASRTEAVRLGVQLGLVVL